MSNPETESTDPEISPQTSFAVLMAAGKFSKTVANNVADDRRRNLRHHMFVYDLSRKFLGPVWQWDGGFYSFLQLSTLYKPNNPLYSIQFDIDPGLENSVTPPGAVLSISFLAVHIKAPEGTVLQKEFAVMGGEEPALVREAVAGRSSQDGIRYKDWRPAKESEGQAILEDLLLMDERANTYASETGEPFYET